MKELTLQQKNKLSKAKNIMKGGDLSIVATLLDLETKVEEIKNEIPNFHKIVSGVKGTDGIEGKTGPMGPVGPRGLPGIPGHEGKAGKDGIDGLDGFIGPMGPMGPEGPYGPQGKEGPAGRDAIFDPKIIDKKLEPIVNDLYGKINGGLARIEGMPRGSNWGGFIETQIKAGNNITISKDASGAWVITGTGSGGGVGAWTSLPIDGATTTFSVTSQPTEVNSDGTIFFNQNGYTYSGGTITFINPPQIFAGYR